MSHSVFRRRRLDVFRRRNGIRRLTFAHGAGPVAGVRAEFRRRDLPDEERRAALEQELSLLLDGRAVHLTTVEEPPSGWRDVGLIMLLALVAGSVVVAGLRFGLRFLRMMAGQPLEVRVTVAAAAAMVVIAVVSRLRQRGRPRRRKRGRSGESED